MIITYDRSSAAWERYEPFLERLITKHAAQRVCEIGAGANPSLSLEFVARTHLDYILVDPAATELAKAPGGYRKIAADIHAAGTELGAGFDLVCSRMVVEHLDRPAEFHRGVFDLLGESGRAFHFFPTLYAPPFVANAILPDALTAKLLPLVLDDRDEDGAHGKFVAHYHWCRGPTGRQIARFAQVGFDVEEYVGFFGHGYYRKLPPLQALHDRFTTFLIKHPIPALTSLAFVVLRKRGSTSNNGSADTDTGAER